MLCRKISEPGVSLSFDHWLPLPLHGNRHRERGSGEGGGGGHDLIHQPYTMMLLVSLVMYHVVLSQYHNFDFNTKFNI